MPIYEYQCRECGKNFELLVSSAQKKTPLCPECGSEKTEKKLSAFAPRSSANTAGCCPHAESCPSAGGHVCGCGCGCHGH